MVLMKRRQEFERKERIATSLVVDQLRERKGALRLAMERIGDQLSEVFPREWRQHDLPQDTPGTFDLHQRACERMRGVDLVVPIRSDQQQMPHVWLGQQIFEEIERG